MTQSDITIPSNLQKGEALRDAVNGYLTALGAETLYLRFRPISAVSISPHGATVKLQNSGDLEILSDLLQKKFGLHSNVDRYHHTLELPGDAISDSVIAAIGEATKDLQQQKEVSLNVKMDWVETLTSNYKGMTGINFSGEQMMIRQGEQYRAFKMALHDSNVQFLQLDDRNFLIDFRQQGMDEKLQNFKKYYETIHAQEARITGETYLAAVKKLPLEHQQALAAEMTEQLSTLAAKPAALEIKGEHTARFAKEQGPTRANDGTNHERG